jgi:hypothetical protein
MPPSPGSYQWWRDNYTTDAEFQRVCGVLKGYGVDCSAVEVDHFPPNASYAGSTYDKQLPYAARPAFPVPKYLHRFHSGDGGMGGHVSSTGSTFVAKTWTPQLGAKMSSGNFYSAMKQDIVDKQNVALGATNGQDRKLFNKLLAPAVELVQKLGMISDAEYYDLLNDLGVFGA